MQDETYTPQEDDAFVGWDGNASVEGKHLGQYGNEEGAVAAITRWAVKNNYYPNVWTINDHGNTTLLSVNFDTGEYEYTETAYV